jgi:hypothetical protein
MPQIHWVPTLMHSFLQSTQQTATGVLNIGYSRFLSKLLHSSSSEKKGLKYVPLGEKNMPSLQRRRAEGHFDKFA